MPHGLKLFRDRFDIPVKDEELEPSQEPNSAEACCLSERRTALGRFRASAAPASFSVPDARI